jgi:hypothetical protein
MSYNVERDSGMAERMSWVQIPSADYYSIPQGSDDTDCYDRRYAQLVQVVGELSISAGDVNLSLSGLEAINTAISGIALSSYDKICDIATSISASNTYLESISASNDVIASASDDYASVIRVSGTAPSYTFIMTALPGTLTGDSDWKIKRIYEDGESVNIDWADGNNNFDNAASGYLSASYS